MEYILDFTILAIGKNLKVEVCTFVPTCPVSISVSGVFLSGG